jgi:hypothetical protein
VAKLVGFKARVIGTANITQARHDDETSSHVQGDCAREHRASWKTRKLPACAIHQAGGIHAQDRFAFVMAVDGWRLRNIQERHLIPFPAPSGANDLFEGVCKISPGRRQDYIAGIAAAMQTQVHFRAVGANFDQFGVIW